jgi:hypothetical protein
VQDESGLVWREEKDPMTPEQITTPNAQQIPVLFIPK